MTDITRLHPAPDGRASNISVRMDLPRDVSFFVQRNVMKHIHVTIGKGQATLIMHPHAAERLIADLRAVLDGKEIAYD